jgi:uncharacterized protein YhbP (UPF0306 family)
VTTEEDLQAVQAYLAAHNTMTVASSSGDIPWAAAVFYVADANLDLYFKSAPDTRHMMQVDDNPLVAATIQDDGQAWESIRGLQLLGTCTWVEDTAIRRIDRLYEERCPFLAELDQDSANENERILAERLRRTPYVQLRPQFIRLIDNSLGFGHKIEIQPQS